MLHKVVITDTTHPPTPVEEAELTSFDVQVVRGQCRTEADVIALAQDASALLVQYAPITRRVIEHLERCRVIVRCGVGYDNIDVETATAFGIYCANVPDYCVDEVSDHTLALILDCVRKVTLLDSSVKAGCWDWRVAAPVRTLRGAVLGLIGLGRIPRTMVPKAQALGMVVLAHDPYLSEEVSRRMGVEPVELEDLLRRSDIVSLHVPLTDATRGMIGSAQLRLMKPTAYLVNTARGGLVDEEALCRGLQEGWIAGAALDVLASEPPDPAHPLLKLKNCLVTPHVAFHSEQSLLALRQSAAREVARVLSGHAPRHIVNRGVVPRAWKDVGLEGG